MKEESRIRETSLNENIKEQEVSRGKVGKGFSGWLLVVMTMADLALLIAAVLCVHHLFIKTASETEQALHVQTERVSDTAYGSAQMRDSKTGIGKSGKREAGITETKAQSEGNTEPQTEENVSLTERENADRKQRQQKKICEKLYENHRELLILVNKDNALASDYNSR